MSVHIYLTQGGKKFKRKGNIHLTILEGGEEKLNQLNSPFPLAPKIIHITLSTYMKIVHPTAELPN